MKHAEAKFFVWKGMQYHNDKKAQFAKHARQSVKNTNKNLANRKNQLGASPSHGNGRRNSNGFHQNTGQLSWTMHFGIRC